ncbi:MAG: DUF4097 domain-containing protein [Actinomycetota bacterium]|nr:DUF4097 domain-containing protein [Actinomycetota bacterium]
MTTTEIALDGPISLHARAAHGTLTVLAEEGISRAVVSIESHQKDSDIAERTVVVLRGSTLVVATPRRGGVFDFAVFGGPSRDRDAVDIRITVPAGTEMKLSSYTAPITVVGRSGSTDVTTGAADIDLDSVDGHLRLRFGSGAAHVARVTGSVEARSGKGRAHFEDIGGDLSAATGSGSLEVGTISGAVRTRTGAGSATLSAVFGDVDLASGSGGVEIGLPAGRDARLDVTTGSGRVRSELPVDDAPSGSGRTVSIRARTGSGDIRLFRAS